jgi:ATP-binding cassette, subfamily B, heavy metal transporter
VGKRWPGKDDLARQASTPLGLLATVFLRRHHGSALAVTAVSVLAYKGFATAAPFIFRLFLDRLQTAGGSGDQAVAVALCGYVGFLFLGTIFGDGKDLVFVPLEQRVLTRLFGHIFGHLQSLSVGVQAHSSTGGLMRILDRGYKAVETFFRFFVFNIVPAVLESLLVCAVLWLWYPPIFGWVLASTLALYGIFTVVVAKRRLKLLNHMTRIDHKSRSYALDSLTNRMTVKAFGRERYEQSRYRSILGDYQRLRVRLRLAVTLMNLGQASILWGGLAVLLWASVKAFWAKQLVFADVALMNTVLLQFIMPFHELGHAYYELKQSWIDMNALVRILALPPETHDEDGAAALTVSAGDIVFDKVFFSYPEGDPIFQGLTLRIPGGSTAAFVGTSGVGKTTLFALLMRFLQPDQGQIFIDGQNLATCTRASVRKAMGLVAQETLVFDDTLGANIRYGNSKASQQDVDQAVAKAQLDQFIHSLPHGYQTQVGERGVRLSGGQRQRLAIARALLKDPAIFLFDEATSALDLITEAHMQRDIFAASRGKTTLIIAHRLSSIVGVDQIFVLEQGRIIQQGSHGDLIAQPGLYQELWQAQAHA